MKDIIIDNNIAKNFATPLDQNYKDLVEWLINFNQTEVDNGVKKKEDFAHLVVSQKLLTEYFSAAQHSNKATSIPVIVNKLISQGLLKLSKEDIEKFMSNKFTKTIKKKLRSNSEDHCHIVTVLLSQRKYLLTNDQNLTYDLKKFPGFSATVEKRPEDIGYK